MHPLGQTRTVIQPNHAFIAPDGHVPAALPGWTQTQGIILISPRMRNIPRFTQYIAQMENGGTSGMPLAGVQRFAYMLEGRAELQVDGETIALDSGKFAYIPADVAHTFSATATTKLMIFEKPYTAPIASATTPLEVVHGDAWAGDGDAFLGDENARLRVLLPTDTTYDMAVNLFTFQPGTALPFAETHIMEHGLYLLEGQGIYRLDDNWYPIQAGDVIWMGPYCPQWFCAIGRTQSTYIYYKDVNRDPFV
ncbi:MAG: (S)-ureidoglycine aminohydrolase [Aggregatilineales bacterium]